MRVRNIAPNAAAIFLSRNTSTLSVSVPTNLGWSSIIGYGGENFDTFDRYLVRRFSTRLYVYTDNRISYIQNDINFERIRLDYRRIFTVNNFVPLTFRDGTLRYGGGSMLTAHRLLIFNTVYLHQYTSLLETITGPGLLMANVESGEGFYLTGNQEFHERK